MGRGKKPTGAPPPPIFEISSNTDYKVQCPICGGRNTTYRNGKAFCAYCGNEKERSDYCASLINKKERSDG